MTERQIENLIGRVGETDFIEVHLMTGQVYRGYRPKRYCDQLQFEGWDRQYHSFNLGDVKWMGWATA
jgi:hypothetical protein